MEGGMCLFMFSRPATEDVSASETTASSSTKARDQLAPAPILALSPAPADPSYGKKTKESDTKLSKSAESEAKITSQAPVPTPVPQTSSSKLSQLGDLLLYGVDMVRKKFIEYGETRSPERTGVPVLEQDINKIMTYPPPTWSMMTEDDVEQTRHPVLTPSLRKPATVQVALKNLEKDEKQTLFERFKQKSQVKSIMEAASSRRGPFTPSRGRSSETFFPSLVGKDDTSKTALDINDEESNQKFWDKLREKATKDEEVLLSSKEKKL